MKAPKLNRELIPSPLDMKNGISHEDIFIDYPPFVYNVRRENKMAISSNKQIKMLLF